jgi:hypothetical protein
MEHSITNTLRHTSLCLCFLFLIGCSGYSVLPKQQAPDIPNVRYERIIKLYNPEGIPDKTLAGIVHVTGKATVCTDYPREETIKSLDDLTAMEKLAFANFQNYAIKDGEELLGYVSISISYRANIWRNKKDPICKYKVQIIMPERSMGHAEHDGVDKSIMSW